MSTPRRYRITYSKLAAMRFTGHLDLQRTWERTLRRARLPLAYSSGFRPRPRIVLGSALPLGLTSQCELIDIWLDEPIKDDGLLARVRQAAPPGIEAHSAEEVPLQAPSLPTAIVAAEYEAMLEAGDEVELEGKIESLLRADHLPRVRRGKPYDLRPLIEELQVQRAGGEATLRMRLAARAGATGRPEEVLAALGFDAQHARVRRCLVIMVDESEAPAGSLRRSESV